MKLTPIAWKVLPAAFLLVLAGCAQIFTPQPLGENLATEPGVESNHPAFIDGDTKTTGETTFPVSEGSTRFGVGSPPSEAYVLFPKPHAISKVVIYSTELRGIDLLIEDPVQGWQPFEKYDGLKGPVITLNLKKLVWTSGIKIRVRTSTGDAAVRRRNVRGSWIAGATRAAAKISEIEVFGPAVESKEPAQSAAKAETQGERESEDAVKILMKDLAK